MAPDGPDAVCVLVRMTLLVVCGAGSVPQISNGQTVSLESLIGDAACDSDAQCHTVAVGSKACGGPERFVAWSSLRTDSAAVQTAASRDAGGDRATLQSPRRMSNCAVVTDPGAYCSVGASQRPSAASAQANPAAAGRCQLRASSSVSAADSDLGRRQ